MANNRLRGHLFWRWHSGFWLIFATLLSLNIPNALSAPPKNPCLAYLRPNPLAPAKKITPVFSRNWRKFTQNLAQATPASIPDLVQRYQKLMSDFRMTELLPPFVNELLQTAAVQQSRIALDLLGKVNRIQTRLQTNLWAKGQALDQVILRMGLSTVLRELQAAQSYIPSTVVPFEMFSKNIRGIHEKAMAENDPAALIKAITPLVKKLRQFFISQDASYLAAIFQAGNPKYLESQLRDKFDLGPALQELHKIYQDLFAALKVYPLRIRQDGHVLAAPVIDNPITNYLLYYYRYLVLWRSNLSLTNYQEKLNKLDLAQLRQFARGLPTNNPVQFATVQEVYINHLKTIDDFYQNYHSPQAITPREFMAWKRLTSTPDLTTALIELRAAHILAVQELDRGEVYVPPALVEFIRQTQQAYEDLFWVEHHLNVLLNVEAVAFNIQARDLAKAWQKYWPELNN